MSVIRLARAFFFVAGLLVSSAVFADFSGSVVGVVDGDTLDVLVDNRPVRVRLAQIDAPERSQAFGSRAKQKLSDLTFHKVVSVSTAARPDRWGRQLGMVYVAGVNVNAEMVSQGFAWAYRQYLSDASLLRLEEQARGSRRGLWADATPVEPWLFRKNK